jgi:hypothetical protein
VVAEKILSIIEVEIELARPYPKQRQTHIRLTPGPPSDFDFRAWISSQAWKRYKVRVIWEQNQDITIDLYPDY